MGAAGRATGRAERFDIAVAGAGPAGLAAATACAEAGLVAALVAAGAGDRLAQHLRLLGRRGRGAGAGGLLRRGLAGGRGGRLAAPARRLPYGLLDNDALHGRLSERFVAAGGQVVDAVVPRSPPLHLGLAAGAGRRPRGRRRRGGRCHRPRSSAATRAGGCSRRPCRTRSGWSPASTGRRSRPVPAP